MTKDQELENVVIIGAATAGMNLVLSLLKSLPCTHRIVLIEANPVGYWSIGALRASVLPGFEEKVVHDLTPTTVFGSASTRHILLSSTRVVDIQPDYVVVDKDVTSTLPESELVEGGKSKIRVDKAVLAVGSDYGFPARITPGTQTKEEVLDGFRKMQRDISAAQEILVVGGGPTGVEFVGEVLDVHPNKVVTLITRGPGLVTTGKDSFGGLSAKLLSQLKSKGVRVILNDSLSSSCLEGVRSGPIEPRTFTSEKGEEISADFILLCSGGRPNTSWLQQSHPDIVDPSTSLIKVGPTFELSTKGWDRYYAVGDASNSPGPKVSFMAAQHAPLLATNLVTSIKGESEARLKKAGGPAMTVISVPLGKSGGASYLGFGSVGAWLTGAVKGKSLFVGQFEGWFKA